MQQTYTARLDLDDETVTVFDAMGELYGRLKHKLYARMAAAPAQTPQEWKEAQAAKRLADQEQRAAEGKAPRKVAPRPTKRGEELFSSIDIPAAVPLKNILPVKQADSPKKEVLRKPKAEDYKAEFVDKKDGYGITARQFNALASEVDALVKSVTELLKAEQKELLLREAKLKKQAKVQEVMLLKWLEDSRGSPASALDAQGAKLLYRMSRTAQSLVRVEKRLPEVQEQLAANVPAICFGTHKLFRQQFHLEQAGYLKPLTAEQKRGHGPEEIKKLESAAKEAAFECWVADWKCAAQAVCPEGDTTRKRQGPVSFSLSALKMRLRGIRRAKLSG